MKIGFGLFLMPLLSVLLILAACSGGNEPATEELVVAESVEESTTEEVAPASDISLSVFLSSVGDEASAYDMIAQFEKETGITVNVVQAPQSATSNLAQQLQYLAADSSDLDVYQIDVIWPSILAEHAVDLSEYIPTEEIEAHFPAIIENNTVDGKLVGLPWFTSAGLLYYRTDLLEKYGYSSPPATWDELEEMAQTIQDGERAEGNENFWGFVWQGNNYEGLTCDALEWQYSHDGGSIIEPDGTITVNNPNAAAAFERAAAWVDNISPPSVTTYQEEDARGIWQRGNVAFMRNWPYVYSLGNSEDSPIQGLLEATVLPTGGTNKAGTLGGWQLMVSKYSENVEAAAQFVEFMTSREAQKKRAINNSYLPTISSLYQDEDLLEAQPFMGALFDVFVNAVARPSTVTGEAYNEVSAAYFDAVHTILTGEETAEDALLLLEEELVKITNFEVRQP